MSGHPLSLFFGTRFHRQTIDSVDTVPNRVAGLLKLLRRILNGSPTNYRSPQPERRRDPTRSIALIHSNHDRNV